MVKKIGYAITFLAANFGLAWLSNAVADQSSPPRDMAADDVAITGSAASFDNRLPPVIPGEEIQHNGKRTKVWSTSGPVTVGSVPPAPPAPANGSQPNSLPNNLGVIVDNRSRSQGTNTERK